MLSSSKELEQGAATVLKNALGMFIHEDGGLPREPPRGSALGEKQAG